MVKKAKRTKAGAMLLPKGVTKETLPSGNVRYRFRVSGLPKVTLPGKPFSKEFNRALDRARQGKPIGLDPETATNAQKAKMPFSLASLIAQYRVSLAFTEGRSPSTRRQYELFLDRMVANNGHRDVRKLNAKTVRQLRDSIKSPVQANRYISILGLLIAYACECGWRETNPVRDVAKRRVPKSTGYHSWTDEEMAHFLANYPEGTRERLAFLLQYDTAQRPSDVCRFGHPHLSGNALNFRQQKTGKTMVLYLSQQTMSEIARHPLGMTFIQTVHERPFTVKGYQQWFSERCSRIGLKHCSAHGLRKARSRAIAERGHTIKQIQSVTGHETSSEVDRYTKAASQKTLAREIASAGLDLPTPVFMGKTQRKTQ